ncbi:acetyl-CoA hydrolase/transferase family protein [Moheibacter lacus]|uniref:Acetyl-CoA hydrolase/transferase family protein n=1 Tax=Moheibacter lacus TaxID=2745851 RepID=A0A838ZRI7_9FLAO|nr:acetyl-CoA hydrolase/transferase family protein [Moheibacter lacus]MBA5628973.1 acetyl-CoA hydrolase/transferase family protein [Moheibacter lacus]
MENHQFISGEEAVNLINSGDRVFVHGSAATPLFLLNLLLKRAGEISDVEIVSISMFGEVDWKQPGVTDSFYLNSLFVSSNIREWANSSRGRYVPIFLSEIPLLFENGYLPLDVAIVQVSPPDQHGYCSLGTSVDAAWSAVRTAKKVIAQVNPKMPRTLGDSPIHSSKFSAMVWHETELPSVDYGSKINETIQKIGENVAGLIEDGSTLQAGIGAIPDAVLNCLKNHKDLGIHTEMFSDGVIPLIASGVVNNEKKKILRGKTVTSFVAGTQKVYDFVHDNPSMSFMNVSLVNDSGTIRQNPRVVAINSALEVDLTGQICSDSIGTYQYSGIGGQMDFMRGAALSAGGKPIIAIPSVTNKGISRITPFLKEGAGVVTTRGHAHYIVTEYGVVNLYGKNLEQRSKLLIGIAHPDHREALEKAHFERFQ